MSVLWINAMDRLPKVGELITKRWKGGAVWAGKYAGTAKGSSFDEWASLESAETTRTEVVASLLQGEELDLTKGSDHKHPEINDQDQYLCQIDGRWFFGKFSKVWFGWSFSGWINPVGLQYDTPGTNASKWQRIIRVKIGRPTSRDLPHSTIDSI